MILKRAFLFYAVIALLNSLVNAYPYFPTCSNFDARTTLLTTLNGKVQGNCLNITVNYASKPKKSTPIVSFLGVPYAQPPLANLRFKSPVPVKNWTNTLNGTKLPNRCIQISSSLLRQSEDCLTLSIFVPYNVYLNAVVLKNNSYRVPIHVFIHGGNLMSGASLEENHEPSTFVAMTNLIHVSINYRLNVFGFLYVNSSDANGNQGILDQSLALKWIYENAPTFGGDNKRIALAGQSAGGFSVGFHLVYRPSWPYFNSAIIESGNLLDLNFTLISTDQAIARANGICSYFNCSKPTTNQTLQCLQQITNVSLLAQIAGAFLNYPLMVLDNVMIQQQPKDSFASGNFKKVNLLIGSNTKDSAYFLSSSLSQYDQLSIGNYNFLNLFFYQFYRLYPFNILRSYITSAFDVLKSIFQIYVPLSALSNNSTSYFDYLLTIATDSMFRFPAIQLGNYESQVNASVYVYSYGYHISSSPFLPKYQAVHAEELYMVFGEPLSSKSLPLLTPNLYSSVFNNYSAYERNISESMVNYWSNFIKYGKPSLINGEWPQFNSLNDSINRSIMYLNGNNSQVLNFQLNDSTYSFWTTRNALGTGFLVATLTGHTDLVIGLTLLKNGFLVSASQDKTIKIWNLVNYTLVNTILGHTNGVWCVCTLSNSMLASGSADLTIKIWNITNLSNITLISTLTGHTNAVRSLTFLSNGLLASASYDKTIKIWNLTSFSLVNTLTGHTNIIYSIIQLKNGILASSSADRTVKYWNVSSASLITTLNGHTSFVSCLIQLSTGNLVSGTANPDSKIRFWNQNNGSLIQTISNQQGIWSLAELSLNKNLISGDSNGNITMRSSSTGYSTILSFSAHSSYIFSLVALPQNYFASSSADQTIKIWS